MSAQIFGMLDELLRSPDAVAERIRRREDLRPLAVSALLALVLGAGTFGASRRS